MFSATQRLCSHIHTTPHHTTPHITQARDHERSLLGIRSAYRDHWTDTEKNLFEELRSLRRSLSVKNGVAPYMVFGNRTLFGEGGKRRQVVGEEIRRNALLPSNTSH